MRLLTELPAQPRNGREELYPWTEWFDGQPRLLEYGIDFDCDTKGFRSTAYAAARRHAVKISAVTCDGGLAIQSY